MKLHALKMPDETECGISGRALRRDVRTYLVSEAETLFAIRAAGESVTCRACLRSIARHGEPLPWPDLIRERGRFMAGKKLRRPSHSGGAGRG